MNSILGQKIHICATYQFWKVVKTTSNLKSESRFEFCDLNLVGKEVKLVHITS